MKLDAYIDSWRTRTFSWNGTICAHFAAGWVHVCEGRSPMDALANDPRSVRDCAREIDHFGSLKNAVTKLLGRDPLSSARFAQTGDIVLFDGSLFGVLGICNGRTAFVLSDEGVISIGMEDAKEAWRIGL